MTAKRNPVYPPLPNLAPGNSLIECWLDMHRPCGQEPISNVLRNFLDLYESTYNERPQGTINLHTFGKWRRGDKPVPAKVQDLMRAELIDYAFGNDYGPEFCRRLCDYLRLPVPADLG